MVTSEELKAMMSEIRYEPTRLLDILLGQMEEHQDGQSMVMDPSMPLPHLFESSVVMTSAAIERDEVLNYRSYPIMANTEEDLYYHMSDVEYEGMFAGAGGGWFYIYLSEEEVITRAARVGNTGTKKITIPKHTQIVINDLVFTMQYPINLIVKSHGAVDVVYDGSRVSPLQSLSGNRVDWRYVTVRNVTDGQKPIVFIRMRIYLKQMRLTSYTYSLSNSNILKKEVELTDSFYYARAFSKSTDGSWKEIKTSHSQQIFDANDPTLLLRVIENRLIIELPYVYFATNLVSRDIRVDVYTTKGPILMDLTGLEPSAFVATFRDLDNDDAGVYSAPLEVMNTITVISDDVVSGGTEAPSFEERRSRMLTNSHGAINIPVSPAQVGTTLAELGFDTSTTVDDLMERTILASRAMPVNENGQASTGIDAAVMTLKRTAMELLEYDAVTDNGSRITVAPDMLYKDIDGVLTIISDADREEIDSLSGDALANKINEGYLYTPFHYVLDSSNNNFSVRPYYLTNPTVDVTSYSKSNDTLGLTVASSNLITIEIDGGGYRLTVVSSSNDVWRALDDSQVHVQLAFTPELERRFAFTEGVQIGKTPAGERVFEFRIDSNWDINEEHLLSLLNFTMFDMTPRTLRTKLKEEFSLIWSVSDYSVQGQETSSVDTVLGNHLLPATAIGIYQETLEIQFGSSLAGLWARSRAMAGTRKYLTHTANVQARYASNVYEVDPQTGKPLVQTVEGVRSLVLLHAKDSLIYDEQGDPVWQYSAGDVVLDEFGNAILASERTIQRWFDMVLFDASYRYATKPADQEYALSVPRILVEWVNDTLEPVRSKTQKRTDLFFQPRNTLKRIDVIVDEGESVTIDTAQRLTVVYHVSKEVYQDTDIRDSLEQSAIRQIVSGLEKSVVSRNALESSILSAAGADIINVSVRGLGGYDNDFDVITIDDTSARLCVAKSLVLEPDGKYAVVDSIQIEFRRHSSD